ncbi:tetratricopeptide repeat protein [Streptomyces sp. FBKL.4005]|uniref:tetratricopeptide repeat protein n=1 Tax=Streptomyces sp. FBKL.4005 TaxID=2015515 RepID=UPI001CB8FA18|nr:tetratricopeptide repeat protein [Streptomyces sp. FBKL.4005]
MGPRGQDDEQDGQRTRPDDDALPPPATATAATGSGTGTSTAAGDGTEPPAGTAENPGSGGRRAGSEGRPGAERPAGGERPAGTGGSASAERRAGTEGRPGAGQGGGGGCESAGAGSHASADGEGASAPGYATGGGESTEAPWPTDAENQNAEGPPPTDTGNQSTEPPPPTDGRDEHAEAPPPDNGRDEHAEAPPPTDGRDEHAEAPQPDNGRDEHAGARQPSNGRSERAGAPRPSDAPASAGASRPSPGEDGRVGEAGRGDERVEAVRRVGAVGRVWRGRAHLVACAALLAVAMTGGALALGADRVPASVPVVAGAVAPGVPGDGDLDAHITALQTHLRAQPKDHGGWASLGLAYVEQARTKGDPSRYPQAERALRRSLALAPDNDQALAGRAALAAARHDFAAALAFADAALRHNPYSERALCSRIDALVELGRYAEAARAARTADARKPGIPVFTRYAYVHELRGDVTTARRVLEQALSAATSPGDIAYVATQLGQLAWNQGDHKTALGHYARALAADDGYLPALEGRARARAASGDRAAAIRDLEAVVARSPLPGPLVALGELYEARGAAGDRTRARQQYALVDAWTALARANGVNADLDTALAAADHGDRRAALRAARAEWARRHTVHTADALAWALHVNGRDAEALPYAHRATATGYRSAAFRYHRGVIELATGHRSAGRASLAAALALNPGFSPPGAARARAALEGAE